MNIENRIVKKGLIVECLHRYVAALVKKKKGFPGEQHVQAGNPVLGRSRTAASVQCAVAHRWVSGRGLLGIASVAEMGYCVITHQ